MARPAERSQIEGEGTGVARLDEEKSGLEASDGVSTSFVFGIHFLALFRLWGSLAPFPKAHIVCILAACSLAECWRFRWRSSYSTWRDWGALALILTAQLGPGGWTILYYLLGKAPRGEAAAAAAAVAVYVLGPFFFFDRPWRLPLEVHIVSSLLLLPTTLYWNVKVCDTAVMTSAAAEGVTRRCFAAALRLRGVFAPMDIQPHAESLSARNQCASVMNTLVCVLGFLMPTLLLARQLRRDCKNKCIDDWVTASRRGQVRVRLIKLARAMSGINWARLYLLYGMVSMLIFTLHIVVLSGAGHAART